MNDCILWLLFAAAVGFALLEKKRFRFTALSALCAVFGILYGLILGYTLTALLTPVLLLCAAVLWREGGAT